jgi:hypothetical protein
MVSRHDLGANHQVEFVDQSVGQEVAPEGSAAEDQLSVLTSRLASGLTGRSSRGPWDASMMETPSGTFSSEGSDSADRTTDTERAVHGTASVSELQAFLSAYAWDRLGSPIAKVRFRAGRIDAVWGVELDDGRAVVIKVHRPPADIPAIAAARDAQQLRFCRTMTPPAASA